MNRPLVILSTYLSKQPLQKVCWHGNTLGSWNSSVQMEQWRNSSSNDAYVVNLCPAILTGVSIQRLCAQHFSVSTSHLFSVSTSASHLSVPVVLPLERLHFTWASLYASLCLLSVSVRQAVSASRSLFLFNVWKALLLWCFVSKSFVLPVMNANFFILDINLLRRLMW